jgi:hypothetical protein
LFRRILSSSGDWLKMAQEAYKNIYAYEWQGDNLLLAREALLITFIEYYTEKFGVKPQLRSIKYIAYIIAWNVFQMDGLKGVVPNSCRHNEVSDRAKPYLEKRNAQRFAPDVRGKPSKGITVTHCLIREWGCKDRLRRERITERLDLLTW